MTVLGLDISTTYTGIVVLDKHELPGFSPVIWKLDHIGFKGCSTTWDKVDVVRAYLNLASSDPAFQNISKIVVEDPAKKFSMGQSSATTIVTLARFNGLVSYFARETFQIDPEYIAPSAARKLIGLKMQQKKKTGLSHKEQTAQYIMNNDLKHVVWPTKKNGKIVDWSYDVIDAYVIAKAGLLL